MSETDNSFLIEGSGYITIAVRVQPGAKKSELVGAQGDELKIRIASPPVEGAANAALINFMAETLQVHSSMISLIRGSRNRSKVLKIWGISGMLALDALGPIPS